MSDGEGSVHVPSETEDDSDMRLKQAPRKRKKKTAVPEQLQPKAKKTRVTGVGKVAKLKLAKSQHTITSLLEAYAPETEYGASIRSMNESDQVAEVLRLNKGVDKGTNLAIKSKLITAKYKELLSEKMRQYLIDSRQPVQSMFRANNAARSSRLLSPEFLSVGEWVEVDADRTPGWNSEGGIGVVVGVQDSLADVK